ncbi:MAG: hypothetical protein US60_C0009G0017 [Microgenomates group bacterium GW2011_GWC1_37_8]|uniref:Antitoxin n=1 Tax=Candidatus Woesebacteria bacterium GW2011_GWB1_38_8 TaxID=1618570 RepID=A0A0G0L1T3_9BACT|nr:MAG: hypothetical protein US60_C0009G0017 [Microgenomates group bacterium GW2011_GWC1_37_8]KKQ85938.1 MAG: hypothetical protein UT08_C0003G0101 [Candidatus Woesebacteria bacterium GW2011_GWB1_38_8]
MIIPSADDIKTITDLREDTVALLDRIQKRSTPTIIMHHNSPKAIMLSVKEYNSLLERLEDYEDALDARELEQEALNTKKSELIPLSEIVKNHGAKLKSNG